MAKELLISKMDIQSATENLFLELDALRLTTMEAQASALFGVSSFATVRQYSVRPLVRLRHEGIETFTVVRNRPLPALALPLLLQAIADHCASRLLRLKDLVAIEKMPGRPAAIHGVRYVVSAPDFLDR